MAAGSAQLLDVYATRSLSGRILRGARDGVRSILLGIPDAGFSDSTIEKKII
eukprot:CAMPEP_0194296972 /NCGR_PEP_ID=MMETSP0169-20130528/57621_1 /TAXON_ID=218684 /ORGANISM="Corethron pennatum, Strain L29A3" /LENGTH=51 /DNA_ID=CAMNT_0039046627 /DNA_START=1046 /DNA_END=1201 /DNA_ORIENTATION=+